MGSKQPHSTHTTRFNRAVGRSFTVCASKVQAYGLCVKEMIPEVNQGKCQREFMELKDCFKKTMKETK